MAFILLVIFVTVSVTRMFHQLENDETKLVKLQAEYGDNWKYYACALAPIALAKEIAEEISARLKANKEEGEK